MTTVALLHPTKRDTRRLGLLYLMMGLGAPFAFMYVPRTLIVRGDAAATAANILAHQTLFRLGIFAELFSSIAFIFLALALYRFFEAVSKPQARALLALVLVAVAVSLLNVVNHVAALAVFRGAELGAAFDQSQRNALGMLLLGLHQRGIFVAEIFWGLWLFPLGTLAMRSGWFPRILGVLLLANGGAYVLAALVTLLLPEYARAVNAAVLPALLGELWFILWLFKGPAVQSPAPAPA